MSWLLDTVYEVTWLEEILNHLVTAFLFSYAAEHFFKFLYWKTKIKWFKKTNWMSSDQEIEAYCAFQDLEKQMRIEKKENKRG